MSECQRYRNERIKYKINGISELDTNNYDEQKNILNYLKHIRLYDYI